MTQFAKDTISGGHGLICNIFSMHRCIFLSLVHIPATKVNCLVNGIKVQVNTVKPVH